jgi:hypothetical protein
MLPFTSPTRRSTSRTELCAQCNAFDQLLFTDYDMQMKQKPRLFDDQDV